MDLIKPSMTRHRWGRINMNFIAYVWYLLTVLLTADDS